MSSSLPAAVAKFIQREGLHASAMASVSFDPNWQLLGRNGAQEALGLAGLSDAALGTLLRDVCSGWSKLHGPPIAQLTLPNGSACELHLIAERDRFHALLLDRREQIEAVRALQQAAQDNALSAQERGKQLRAANRQIKLLTQEREALKTLLACERAQRLLAPATAPASGLRPDALHARALALLAPLARERAVRLEFDVAAISRAPLLEVSAQTALGLPVYGVSQALLRARAGDVVKATLRCSSDALQLSVNDSGPAHSVAQRALIWESAPPSITADACELALYMLGTLTRQAAGRVTLPADSNGAVSLIASVPRTPQITERVGSKQISLRGYSLVLLGETDSWREQLSALHASVAAWALHEDSLNDVLAADAGALLIRPGIHGTLAKRMVFKLRAKGFAGRIIGIAAGAPSGAAWWDAWLLEPLDPAALKIALG